MEIFVERENRTLEFKVVKKLMLKDVLKELGVSSESVILVKNDEVCLDDEFVSDSDKVKLLSVVSGG